MEPIVAKYDKNRRLYALQLHPDGRVLTYASRELVAFSPLNYADYVFEMNDPNNLGIYVWPGDSAQLDFVPITALFERAMVDDGNGGITFSPATFGDDPIGVGSSEGVNVASLAGVVEAARSLSLSSNLIVVGTVVPGVNTVSQMTTDLSNPQVGAYVRRAVIWLDGPLAKCVGDITASDGAGQVTFSKMPVAPVPGNRFAII